MSVERDSAPNTWPWVKFGDLFEVQQGKALSQKARQDVSPRSFLRTANVLWGRLKLDVIDHMDFSPKEEAKYQLEAGDLLVCEGGEIGRSAIWGGELEVCYYQNHLHRCRTSHGDADPGFYMYWMQYAFRIADLYMGHANVTTIANLSKSRLSAFELPHPPLPEQRAIAHILRTVQRAREQTEQVIGAARELKRSLMKHLFTYGPVRVQAADATDFQDSDMGLIPARWEVAPLEEIATLQRGFDITKDEQTPGPYPVVSSSGPQSTHSKFKVEAPGVVVGRKGSVGAVHFVQVDFWPHDTTLWVKDFHGHSPEFVFRLLERFDFTGYVTGVANPSLNRNHVHPARVGLPSRDEQAQIVAVLRSVDGKIAVERQRREALDSVFISLLHDLMTARLPVEHLAAEFV
jgi:type I restriction enzyme, S subunit